MHHVELQPARFQVEATSEGLRVAIPAHCNWFAILFLLVWLGGWTFGEISVASQLLHPGDKTPIAFLAVWLAGWTFGGLFAATAVLWQLAGREIVVVGPSTLAHRVEIFGLGFTRSYSLPEVKNLRAADFTASTFGNQRAWFPPLYGSGFGPVAFDYGARTIRFAPSLGEAEAKLLVNTVSPRLPRAL